MLNKDDGIFLPSIEGVVSGKTSQVAGMNEIMNNLIGNDNYLDKRKMSIEDTIEDLKNSKKYKLGDVVEVLGYHTKGDGSHHKRVAKDKDDGSGEQGQNGIWWCIVHSGEVNVSWFGAKGDGVSDDREVLTKAMKYNCKKIYSDRVLLLNSVASVSEGGGHGTIIPLVSNKTISVKVKVGEFFRGGTQNYRIFSGFNKQYSNLFGEFENIVFKDCEFDLSGIVMTDRYLLNTPIQFGKSSNCKVLNCRFFNGDTSNVITSFVATNDTNEYKPVNLEVSDCVFENICVGENVISGKDHTTIFLDVVSGAKISNNRAIETKGTAKDCGAFFEISGHGAIVEKNYAVGYLRQGWIKATSPFAGDSYGIRISDNIFSVKRGYVTFFAILSKKIYDVIYRYNKVYVTEADPSNNAFLGFEASHNGTEVSNVIVESNDVNMKGAGYILHVQGELIKGLRLLNNNFEIDTVFRLGGKTIENCTVTGNTFNLKNTTFSRIFLLSTDSTLSNCYFVNNTINSDSITCIGATTGNPKFTLTNSIVQENRGDIFKKIDTTLKCEKSVFETFLALNLSIPSGTVANAIGTVNITSTISNYSIDKQYSSVKIDATNESFALLKTTPTKANFIALTAVGNGTLFNIDCKITYADKRTETLLMTTLNVYYLDTPYYAYKMQQEDVYEDFVAYMDEKLEYDKEQRYLEEQRQLAFESREDQEQTYEEWLATQSILIPDNEPQPSEKLLEFKNKYVIRRYL